MYFLIDNRNDFNDCITRSIYTYLLSYIRRGSSVKDENIICCMNYWKNIKYLMVYTALQNKPM